MGFAPVVQVFNLKQADPTRVVETVRAFLTPQHIEVTQQTPEVFWKDLEARCASVTSEQTVGTYDWAMLHFRRGGARIELNSLESCEVREIGYEAASMDSSS